MNAREIKQALSARDSKALNDLRISLSLQPGETTISRHDPRLSLAERWLEISPAAQDLFDTWAAAKTLTDGTKTVSFVISVLSSLLSLFSFHLPHHLHGVSIIKVILSPQWHRLLDSYLSGADHDQILAAMGLFYAMSMFGSGRVRKLVFEAFPWANKSLSKLLYMRRKGNQRGDSVLVQPDIRTQYILFILSMLDQDAPPTVKTAFLDQHGDVFMSIFKGLHQDHCPLIRRVLQVCWEGIWSDPKIRRTTKVGLFNEVTISHLLKLYDRVTVEEQGSEPIPADVVHHFLLAICTRPGHGVCFSDRGWYPRETNENEVAGQEDVEGAMPKGAKIHNKILANVLQRLKINEDPRQQELALKITAACPELVSGYWSMAALALEPRLSSKWIVNVMFVGQIISQATPTPSFLLPGSLELYKSTPPRLSTVMANVLPPIGTRSLFSKGLQSTTAMVRHCTALVLAKCLRKLAEVMRTFKMIEIALEEDEEGLWCRRRKEIETEARRRAPDFHVIIAFSQQTSTSPTNLSMQALLSESSQRLLWLYQECLPEVVAEARFEVGKLTMNSAQGLPLGSSDNSVGPVGHKDLDNVPMALQSAKQLHVLRLLGRSDKFTWTGKAASSSHSYLHVLLKMFCDTRVHALRTTLWDLLRHVLSESMLFQEDPAEVEIWLASLPSGPGHRGQGAEAPDGAPLTDEADAIVKFLDECAQLCLKTPHRYIEAMSSLVYSHTSSLPSTTVDTHHRPVLLASPLLMTLLEQVMAKVSGKLMTPSDALAVFTFMRRLLVMLASKQEDVGYDGLHAILDQLHKCAVGQPFPDYPSICFGIRREMSIAAACLHHLREDPEETCYHESKRPSDETVANFLDHIEQVPVPASETARVTSAFELVDWLRLVDANVSSSNISRLASIIQRLHEPALWALVHHLHPSEGHLWDSDILKLISDRSSAEGVFVWLYFLSKPQHLREQRVRDALLGMIYSHSVTYVHLERLARLLTHDISISLGRHDLTTVLLVLLSDLLTRASGTFTKKDLRQLKARVVTQSATIHSLCISEDLAPDIHEAIQGLVQASFDHTDGEDQNLLSSISSHWAEKMSYTFSSGQLQVDTLRFARPWIKFMLTDQLITAINLMPTSVSHQSPVLCETLEEILASLRRRILHETIISKLSAHKLLELLSLFPQCTLLEEMLSAMLTSQFPSGFNGHIAVSISDVQQLSTLFSGARSTHASKLRSLPSDLISQFLDKETWTEFTARVIICLLYTDTTSTQAFAAWLNSGRWKRLATHAFTATLAAFLDCTALSGGDLSQFNDEVLHDLLKQLFPRKPSQGQDEPRNVECISGILTLADSRRPRLVSMLQEKVATIPIMDLTLETTLLARKVLGMPGSDTLTTSIVDRALQWAVRHCSHEAVGSEDSNKALENLKHVAERQSAHKSHFVEPLLASIIQHRLSDVNTVELAVVLANRTPLKPAVVNRLLQNILQHPHFPAICGRDKSTKQKDQIVCLLDTLFHLHPGNTCQPSHIEPVFRVYGGTLSAPDRQLLAIMRLFEAERRESLSAFFAQWSPSPDAIVTSALEAVQNFDPVRMLRTCLAFPSWRRFSEEKGGKDSPANGSMYDPLLVITLCAQMLVESPPTSALGWVQVFRTNVVSLLIRCLSSKDANIREAAHCQIARLWESMQGSDMQEQAQVIYVFGVLKNVIHRPANHEDPPRRLSTYTSLILLHALRGIFYPSNFIYPHTARFLLQRPELDVSDVPMLFKMLYSSSDEWKKERGWILRMLGDGMRSTEDWKVLKRRHTWDLMASLFQISKNNPAVRAGILEMLANLTCNAEACISLVLKSSILSWIEMQVGDDDPSKESIAWLRILENIVLMVDTCKMNRATGGEWCRTICRTLSTILRRHEKVFGILHQAGIVLLRLSLIEGVPDHSLHSTLSHAVEYLLSLEPSVDVHRFRPLKRSISDLSLPPHQAQGLQEMPPTEDPLQIWGEVVEALWRVGMSLRDGTQAWIILTQRLLVWRALVGDEMCPIGEWARREVVRTGCTSV